MLRCLRSAVCRCCSFASVIHFYEARAKQISIIHCKSLINNSRIDFRNISTLNLLHSPLLVSPEGSIYSLLSLSLFRSHLYSLTAAAKSHFRCVTLRCATRRDETRRDILYAAAGQLCSLLFTSLVASSPAAPLRSANINACDAMRPTDRILFIEVLTISWIYILLFRFNFDA